MKMPKFITALILFFLANQATYVHAQNEGGAGSDQAPIREKSVKPGSNKSFIDPDLDVDSYIKRFEIESREVYVARKEITAACDLKEGISVADIGAGTGLFTRIFSAEVGSDGKVFAVDIAARFVEHIQNEAKESNRKNVIAIQCAENSVNLPANSIDTAFICDVYHHFEFPKSTLSSLHRAIKDGGQLIVVDFDRIPGKSREWMLGHVRAGKEAFRKEIEEAGFVLVKELKIDGLKENYFLKFRKK